MPNFVLTWLPIARALGITAYVIPGFIIKSWVAAAIAAIVLGLVNTVVKSILYG